MTLTAPLHAGKNYTVRFKNDVGSIGTALVITGWVPKHQAAVPTPQHTIAAPGCTNEMKGTVPSSASVRRLTVVVSLDPGESGRLEVLEDGAEHTSEDVTETTTWDMPVDP